MLLPSPLEKLDLKIQEFTDVPAGVEFYIKRDDLIDPQISGNKWRKLEQNILEARRQGLHTILTFGGAYSNHLAATARAGHLLGFHTIGVVRGEETLPLNPTLSLAAANGMKLHYISRERYREKNSEELLRQLQQTFGRFYLIPEGGANKFGVSGCRQIMREICATGLNFDAVFLAAGTGTTAAGMALQAPVDTSIVAVPVLKNGGFLKTEIYKAMVAAAGTEKAGRGIKKLTLPDQFHFGGYARYNAKLVAFMKQFHEQTAVKLDPVYTAKAAYAMLHLPEIAPLRQGKVLLLHTGGLQGIAGFEQRYGVQIY